MKIEKEAIIIRKRNEKCNYTKIPFHQACWQKPRLIQSLSDRMPCALSPVFCPSRTLLWPHHTGLLAKQCHPVPSHLCPHPPCPFPGMLLLKESLN